jgi:predicted MFS family arabinose efflux permease
MAELVTRPGMPAALSSGIAFLIALDVLMAYLPLIGEAAGISPAVVGALLSIRGAFSLASRLVMTRVIRWLGTRAVLVGSMVGSAAALAGMAWSTEVWLLIILMGIFGVGLGIGAPMTASWVAQLAPARMRATAMGVRLSGNRLGQALAPLGLGAVATASGVGFVLVAPAAVLLACAGWVGRAELGDAEPEDDVAG